MIIEMNSGMRHTTEYSDTLTREQRQRAMELMASQFCELLGRSPRENLYWQESVTDLMDLSHEVYLSERLVDSHGRPYGFRRIVELACQVLHVVTPCNPYSMAFNARNRKGVRQMSFFSRYCWLMFKSHTPNPLRQMVKRMNEE